MYIFTLKFIRFVTGKRWCEKTKCLNREHFGGTPSFTKRTSVLIGV